MIIRPAAIGDVPRVHAMEAAWEAEGSSLGFAAADEASIARVVGQCFFVADDAGALVGYVRGRLGDDEWNAAVVPHGERYLEIEDLYVLPELRSHGIGTRLLEAACEWAKAQGVRYLTLYSSSVDTARVVRFYQSAGFQPWAVQMVRRLE